MSKPKMRIQLPNYIYSGVLTDFQVSQNCEKKSLYTSPNDPTPLYLQNARERTDVSVYEMSALVPTDCQESKLNARQFK